MTRFIRNLLVVIFAAVGVFAVAGPADAAAAQPARFTGWSTHPFAGSAHAVMLPAHARTFIGPGTGSCFTGWARHPFRYC